MYVAVEWLGIGLALAKILLRAADKENVADALDDALGGWSLLRAARHRETALGKAIAEELDQQLAGISGPAEDDMRAAAQGVADLLGRLAENNAAVIAASTYPEQFLEYVKQHGGEAKVTV
jgi:hypothetical protein